MHKFEYLTTMNIILSVIVLSIYIIAFVGHVIGISPFYAVQVIFWLVGFFSLLFSVKYRSVKILSLSVMSATLLMFSY